MVTRPSDTLELILRDWGLSLNYSIDEIVGMPSKTTLDSSPIKSGNAQKQLYYWQSLLTDKQIHNILDTVTAFGIDFYGDDVAPL